MTTVSAFKILNVEDNEGSRYATSRFLRRAGFAVVEAATGGDALQVVVEERPHLVVLDINLPDMNGLEVCRRIKTHPVTSFIPVLHLSSTAADSRAKVQGLEGGADAYLTEPVDPEVLIATVKALLRIQQTKEALRDAARHWQMIFSATSDGMALLDQEGRTVRCNQALGSLLGRPVSECTNRPYWELFPAKLQEVVTSTLNRLLEARCRETITATVGDRWLRITIDPVMDEGCLFTGAVSLVSDITEHERTRARRPSAPAKKSKRRKPEEGA